MSVSNSKNNIIKYMAGNFMLIPENLLPNSEKCLLLKNQKCKIRKTIIGNEYMTFLYKIKVDKCVGSYNDKDNPYFKI